MAHKRQDTLTTPKFNPWNKHLRHDGKKSFNRRERRAAKKLGLWLD